MFPTWSRTHTCYAPVAPTWFPALWKITSEHVPSAQFESAIASPLSLCCPYCSPYSSVKVEGAWRADGACMIDVPAFGRGLDSALQTGKDPLPWILNVQSTRYKDLHSAGVGTHMATYRRAEVFGALLEIAPGPWPVNVASSSAAKPHPPLQCQSILAGCFRGGTTTMEGRLEKHYGT